MSFTDAEIWRKPVFMRLKCAFFDACQNGVKGRGFPIMQIEIFTICPMAKFDGKNLTILGALEPNTVYSPKFPAAFTLSVVVKIRFEPGEEGQHKTELVLLDADLHPVFENQNMIQQVRNLNIHIPKNLPAIVHLNTTNFAPLQIQNPGDYYFQLSIDGKMRGQVPLFVLPAPLPNPG